MSERTQPAVVQLPQPFLLDVRTERFVDLMLALEQAGFKVEYVRGMNNRYKIIDGGDHALCDR